MTGIRITELVLMAVGLALLIYFLSGSNVIVKTQNPQDKSLPNIVLIIGDDQGYPYFGFMGADYVKTPNMDILAKSGILFTQGYVPENHCRPSLQTLMTGTLPSDYNRRVDEMLTEKLAVMRFASKEDEQKYKTDFRHHAMQHFKTLPKYLSERGYVSFQGGKWWEFNYQNGGFTYGMTTGWTEEDRAKGGKWFKKFMGGTGLELARATMQPAYDFIENHKDKPFFIWYAPELPHYPFNAPEKYYSIYKDSDMSESARRYYANCTWFDDGVGALLDYLKEQGEFDNTMFIYVNDNGWEQEPHQEFRHDSLRWHNGGDKGKLSVFDQSFRTPIIFSWKGRIGSGKVSTALMHSADIPATILDFLGISIPDHFYGRSYKTVIEGHDEKVRSVIMGHCTQIRSEDDMMGEKTDAYWLRDSLYFFKWNRTEDTVGLFNVLEDPRCMLDMSKTKSELIDTYKSRISVFFNLHDINSK